jgi:hypothetical protein
MKNTIFSFGRSVFVCTFILFYFFADRGFDYHHNGLVLVTAREIADGGVLYRDIFWQYGPAPPYLQALVVKLFGENLLYLNYFAVFCQALSAGIIGDLWLKIYGKQIAIFGILAWCSGAYFFDPNHYMLPWPSDFVLLFYVMTLWSVFKAVEKTKSSVTHFYSFLAGVTLGMCLLSRGVQVGLAFFVVVFSAWYFFEKVISKYMILGFLVIICGAGLYALREQAIGPYFQQTLHVAKEWGSSVASNGIRLINYGVFFKGVRALSLVVILSVLVKVRKLHLLSLTSVLCFASISYLAIIGGVWKLDTNDAYWIYNNERGVQFLSWSPVDLLWLIVVLVPCLVVVGFWRNLQLRNRHFDLDQSQKYFLLITLLGLYSTIFPVPDIAHVWWAVLPGFGVCFYYLKEFLVTNKKFIFVSGLALAITVLPVVQSMWFAFNNQNLVQLTEPKFLAGMTEERRMQLVHSTQQQVLEEVRSEHGPITVLPLCEDSLYYLYGDKLVLPDQYPFYWKYETGFSLPRNLFSAERKNWVRMNQPVIITCRPVENDTAILDLFDYRVIYSTPYPTTDRFNWDMSIRILVPSKWMD